jgi:hypothetical protein
VGFYREDHSSLLSLCSDSAFPYQTVRK